MGTLYLKSDLGALYEWLRSFALIAALVLGICVRGCLPAGDPFAEADIPAHSGAYRDRQCDRRASRLHGARQPPEGHEFGLLTDAFNHMLERIEEARTALQSQLGRLDLLHRITRAIGERQDLPSIFQVVLRNLEDELPIDFGCLCLYDACAEPKASSWQQSVRAASEHALEPVISQQFACRSTRTAWLDAWPASWCMSRMSAQLHFHFRSVSRARDCAPWCSRRCWSRSGCSAYSSSRVGRRSFQQRRMRVPAAPERARRAGRASGAAVRRSAARL